MNPATIAEIVLDSHQRVGVLHPNDFSSGHINRQAIDCIAESMMWEHGGKPIHDTVFKQAAVLMEGIL